MLLLLVVWTVVGVIEMLRQASLLIIALVVARRLEGILGKAVCISQEGHRLLGQRRP